MGISRSHAALGIAYSCLTESQSEVGACTCWYALPLCCARSCACTLAHAPPYSPTLPPHPPHPAPPRQVLEFASNIKALSQMGFSSLPLAAGTLALSRNNANLATDHCLALQ